jgi:hypothetical protein
MDVLLLLLLSLVLLLLPLVVVVLVVVVEQQCYSVSPELGCVRGTMMWKGYSKYTGRADILSD